MAAGIELRRAARRLGRAGGKQRWRHIDAAERSRIMRRVRAAREARRGAGQGLPTVADAASGELQVMSQIMKRFFKLTILLCAAAVMHVPQASAQNYNFNVGGLQCAMRLTVMNRGQKGGSLTSESCHDFLFFNLFYERVLHETHYTNLRVEF
jgi:hypothetical protein